MSVKNGYAALGELNDKVGDMIFWVMPNLDTDYEQFVERKDISEKEATNMLMVIYYMVIIATLATDYTVGHIPKIAYINFLYLCRNFWFG